MLGFVFEKYSNLRNLSNLRENYFFSVRLKGLVDLWDCFIDDLRGCFVPHNDVCGFGCVFGVLNRVQNDNFLDWLEKCNLRNLKNLRAKFFRVI